MFVTFKLKQAVAVFLVGVFILVGAIVLYQPSRLVFSEKEGVDLPIITYHHMLKDSSRWNAYVISPDAFEKDLAYLKENGYETITTEDLIAYVYEGKSLPHKPIMITFDDGFYSTYLYAYPLLKKYGMKAVVSIIGTDTDLYSQTGEENSSYSHLTWERCREIMGEIELLNHTYNLHKLTRKGWGSSKSKKESKEEYSTILKTDIEQLQQRFQQETSYLPRAFTYPYGIVSPESKDIIKELGFLAAFTCNEGINRIAPQDKEGLYQLKRYLRPAKAETNSFFESILKP